MSDVFNSYTITLLTKPEIRNINSDRHSEFGYNIDRIGLIDMGRVIHESGWVALGQFSTPVTLFSAYNSLRA